MSVITKLILVFTVIIIIAIALLSPQFLKSNTKEETLTAGFTAEFLVRPDGYPGLTKAYQFEFATPPKQLDPGLMYKAVADGDVDVICGFATDGRIPAYNLFPLKDDKHFFPPYHAAPLIREETLDKHPELKDVLESLSDKISDKEMRMMNYDVDEKNKTPDNVARTFLIDKGLISDDAKAGSGVDGTITIGGKNFTEQEILGEMLAILIETKTNLNVVRKFNLGGTMICFNALTAGDLDVYPEYTGTGLVNILKNDVVTDPEKAFDTVKSEFKKKYHLAWLKPFGFNNTYVLTMRGQQTLALSIESISDLATTVRDEEKR